MKTNALRAPLIKSAVVLVIFSLLFYLTATTADGSVWSSIGTIFIGTLKTVQWLIGMAIGMVICIAVLIGIFLGAAAMTNPASASRMYEGLRTTLLSWLTPVINLFKSDHKQKTNTDLGAFGQDLKKEINGDIQVAQNSLRNKQTELNRAVNSLSGRLATLEETAATLAAGEQVEALDEEIKGTIATVTDLQDTIGNLKTKITATDAKIEKSAAATDLADLTGRIEALEQQESGSVTVETAPLEKDIAALQADLNAVREKVDQDLKTATDAAAEQPAPDSPATDAIPNAVAEEEHRIFSYFDDNADKEKLAELVASTVKKDMSYKQVLEFVAKELGSTKGEIFTSHPSLSKDYIRQCRREN